MQPSHAAGPRLPAEWEPQSGVLLVWPHPGSDWSADLPASEQAILPLGLEIAARQTLLSVCSSQAHRDAVRRLLLASGADPARLRFAIAPTDDTWARDTAPLTRIEADGRAALIDFRFNGWGGRHPADNDDLLATNLHHRGVFGTVEMHRSERVVEGGALETDGQGTLLAVRRTLVDRKRNPRIPESALVMEILNLTGARRLLLLDHGRLTGDDTDGHIDTLVRFVDRRTLVHVTAEPDDPDHDDLARMAGELAGLRDADGRPYRLVPLPSPGLVRATDGRRLPASYANYQLVNDAILIPVYDTPGDAAAIRILGELHPDREPIAIDARHIATQNGGIHCLCMQFPAGIELTDST